MVSSRAAKWLYHGRLMSGIVVVSIGERRTEEATESRLTYCGGRCDVRREEWEEVEMVTEVQHGCG